MTNNEQKIVDKIVHVDGLRNVKNYIDETQNKYELNTTNHISNSINQIESIFNDFKSQFQTDNVEFKTKIKNHIEETIPSVGAPLIFDMNLELIPSGTEWSYNSNLATRKGLLDDLPATRTYSADYENFNADNLYTFEALVETMHKYNHCTAVIKHGSSPETVYSGCCTRCRSSIQSDGIIHRSATIIIYNAGLTMNLYYTYGSNGTVYKRLSVTHKFYTTYSKDLPLTLTRLEFRGE